MKHNLLYNSAAECIVSVVPRKVSNDAWTQDLFFRHRSRSDVTKVAATTNDVSYRDAVSCDSVPKILFNVWRSRPDFAGGYDWESISSLDLVTGDVSPISSPRIFPVPTEYTQAWPHSLVSARSQGDGVICCVGFKRRTGKDSMKVEYWLSEILFSDGSLRKLGRVDDLMV